MFNIEDPAFLGGRSDNRGYQENVFNVPALPPSSNRGLNDSPTLSSAGASSNDASSSSDNEGELNLVAGNAGTLPLRGIKNYQDSDCLFGRGGGTNAHPGNKKVGSVLEEL